MSATSIFIVAAMFANFVASFFFKESWDRRLHRSGGWCVATIYAVLIGLLLAEK